MFWESRRDQWLLIGTQVGMGYDCLMDKIDLFEDRASNEGSRSFHIPLVGAFSVIVKSSRSFV